MLDIDASRLAKERIEALFPREQALVTEAIESLARTHGSRPKSSGIAGVTDRELYLTRPRTGKPIIRIIFRISGQTLRIVDVRDPPY